MVTSRNELANGWLHRNIFHNQELTGAEDFKLDLEETDNPNCGIVEAQKFAAEAPAKRTILSVFRAPC